MTEVTMYPAGNGDTFLIRHNPTAILIDGGYSSTFQEHLVPDLKALANRGNDLSLVVSTHIDADHIAGLVHFFGVNGSAISPAIIGVRRVWHNSLCSLVFPKPDAKPLSEGDLEILHEICQRGYKTPAGDKGIDGELGALQGSSLASLLRRGRFNWNENDGSRPMIAPFELKLSDDVSISMLGPTMERLSALRNWWVRELRRFGIAGVIEKNALLEDAFEFLCSYECNRKAADATEISHSVHARELADVYQPDDSVTNGSSISLLVRAGSKRLLFLGDSWAEDCERAIVSIASSGMPTVFDAIKLSHHGSRRNTSPELLKLVDSPSFFISSNGERHNHPDFEVLKALVDRPANFCRDVYFNFSTPASRALRKYKSKSNTPFVVHEDCRGRVSLS